MSIEFTWDDPNKLVTEVTAMLRERGEAIAQIPEMAVRRGTVELTALLKQKGKFTPVRTGTFIRSITFTVRKIAKDLIEGRVGSPLEYARYLEEGTGIFGPLKKPITIVAKYKKALFWGAYNSAGKPIMAKRVVIQGMKPRAPFGRAVTAFVPRYLQIIQEELAKEAAS